jgi:hypothetical protein
MAEKQNANFATAHQLPASPANVSVWALTARHFWKNGRTTVARPMPLPHTRSVAKKGEARS